MFKNNNLYWKNRNKNHPNLKRTQFKKGYISWSKDKKNGIYRECKICKKLFYISPCFIKTKKVFCSHKCYGLSRRGISHNNGWLGKHLSNEHRKKISQSNKGKKRSIKQRENMSIAKKKLFILNPHRQDREKSPNWKGGRVVDKGYIYIKDRLHPSCNQQGYVAEHRIVIEKIILRSLLGKEEVHHINKNHSDNHPQNLVAFINHSAHRRFEEGKQKVEAKEIIFDGRKYEG